MRAGQRPTLLVIVHFTIVEGNIENHCTAYSTHLAHSSDGIWYLAKCVLSSSTLCRKHVSVRWALSFLAANCSGERKLKYSCTRHVMVAIIALTHIYIYMSGLFSICFSDRKLRYQTVWFKTRHMATIFTKTSLAARHCAICIHIYYVCHVLLNLRNGAASKVFSSSCIDEETSSERLSNLLSVTQLVIIR